jgi:hypothetical protein
LSYNAGSNLNYFAASRYSEYLVGGYKGLLFVFKLNPARNGYEELCSKQILGPTAWQFGGLAFVSRSKLFTFAYNTNDNRFDYL